MRGQKPVPTVLRLLRGNPREHALPKDEPILPPGATKPAWLSKAASKAWDTLTPKLLEACLVSDPDSTALGLFCEQYANFCKAQKALQDNDAVVTNKHGELRVSPYFKIASDSMTQMQRMLAEFGMTPSSRTRVKATGKPKKKSRLGALLDGSKEDTA